MKRIFFVIATTLVFSSCIKTEYTQGAQGPRGPQGLPGRDGTQINTYYFDVYPDEWNRFGSYGLAGYYCYADITLNALSPEVIDGGAVLVYFIDNVNGQDYDNQLPYLLPFRDNGYFTRIIRYDLQPRKIGLIVEDSDFKTPCPPFNGSVKFKVVVIGKI